MSSIDDILLKIETYLPLITKGAILTPSEVDINFIEIYKALVNTMEIVYNPQAITSNKVDLELAGNPRFFMIPVSTGDLSLLDIDEDGSTGVGMVLITNLRSSGSITITADADLYLGGDATLVLASKISAWFLIIDNKKYLINIGAGSGGGDVLTSNVTYYIYPTTGSDSNAGTSLLPFATINHAVGLIPNNLGGYEATIIMQNDLTYDEYVPITNLYNGMFTLSGISPTDVLVKNSGLATNTINFVNCKCKINIENFSTEITKNFGTGIMVDGCNNVITSYIGFKKSAAVTYVSGLTSMNGSIVIASNTFDYSADKVSFALFANSGGIIMDRESNSAGDTLYSYTEGGQIFREGATSGLNTGDELPYGDVFTIASSGGDYTTIQAALTANATANTLFLVYNDTYIDDTIFFTANNQCVKYVGCSPKGATITKATNICNFAGFTGCVVSMIKMDMTCAVNQVDSTVNGTGGSCNFKDCHIEANISGTNADTSGGGTCIRGTGTVKVVGGTIEYNNSANRTARGKKAVLIETGGNFSFDKNVVFNGICSGTSAAGVSMIRKKSSGTFTMNKCEINLVANIVGTAYGVRVELAEGEPEALFNNFHIENSTGDACCIEVGSNGNPLSLRSSFNHYNAVAGAGTANSLRILDANAEIISQLDDDISADGVYNVLGTFVQCNSPEDGVWKVSDKIITPEIEVTGSSTGVTNITSANAGSSNYAQELPAKAGTFAMTSDVPVKATGVELNTGTNDVKFATAKALVDSLYYRPKHTAEASNATPTVTGGYKQNEHDITALAVNTIFAVPSGTPLHNNTLVIAIKDDGTPRTIGWNAIFNSFSETLPTTTITSKKIMVEFFYDTYATKWQCVGVINET